MHTHNISRNVINNNSVHEIGSNPLLCVIRRSQTARHVEIDSPDDARHRQTFNPMNIEEQIEPFQVQTRIIPPTFSSRSPERRPAPGFSFLPPIPNQEVEENNSVSSLEQVRVENEDQNENENQEQEQDQNNLIRLEDIDIEEQRRIEQTIYDSLQRRGHRAQNETSEDQQERQINMINRRNLNAQDTILEFSNRPQIQSNSFNRRSYRMSDTALGQPEGSHDNDSSLANPRNRGRRRNTGPAFTRIQSSNADINMPGLAQLRPPVNQRIAPTLQTMMNQNRRQHSEEINNQNTTNANNNNTNRSQTGIINIETSAVQERIPEAIQEIVPEAIQEIVPEENEEIVPEEIEEIVPEEMSEAFICPKCTLRIPILEVSEHLENCENELCIHCRDYYPRFILRQHIK